MQILYIIGNGFDINLGLKTTFKNFFDIYQDVKSENDVIQKMKLSIREDISTWANLELKFGEYTTNFKTVEQFDEAYDDLIESLGNYLESIDKEFDFNTVDRESLFAYLSSPGVCLPQGDKNVINTMTSKWNAHEWYLDIMTFNYTTIIEKVATGGSRLYKQSSVRLDSRTQLRDIFHIHGYTDDRMVLGVNDASQIHNPDFKDNPLVANALIKANNNRTQRHTVDELCTKRISKADLICIYGSSLGETDKIWWQEIGKRMIANNLCRVIIYYHTLTKISKRTPWKGERIATSTKEIFLSRMELSESEKDLIRDRIHLVVNSAMFQDLKIAAPAKVS